MKVLQQLNLQARVPNFKHPHRHSPECIVRVSNRSAVGLLTTETTTRRRARCLVLNCNMVQASHPQTPHQSTKRIISRREQLLTTTMGIGGLVLAVLPPPSRAADEVDLLRQASQEGTPFVIPALTPQEYLDRIAVARPQAGLSLSHPAASCC